MLISDTHTAVSDSLQQAAESGGWKQGLNFSDPES